MRMLMCEIVDNLVIIVFFYVNKFIKFLGADCSINN